MITERTQRTLESEARRALAASLSPLPGPKALLVDDALYSHSLGSARLLNLFTDAAFLHEHGVRKIAPLSAPASDGLPVVALIRGINAAAARAAVTAIRRSPSPALVLTTPHRSRLVESIFAAAGMPEIPTAPLPLGFLPFDADLVTLDWPDAYRQIVLEGDNSAILASAHALSTMASALDLEFATIRSAGAAATAVAEDLLETHGQMYPRHENGSESAFSPQSSPQDIGPRVAPVAFASHDAFQLDRDEDEFGDVPTLAAVVGKSSIRRPVSLIIIDRGVDVVSPFLTQWTYEGLLDEAVGLQNNIMELPVASIVSPDAQGLFSSSSNKLGGGGSIRKRLRSDIDPIFAQLRDLNYWAAARQIGSVASSVRDYYNNRPTRETAEIAKVKDYVKGLKDVKSDHWSAAAHTALLAEISARTFDNYEFKRRFELEREMMEGSTATSRRVYIADAIARGESLTHVLRLCCLWSVTSSGIDAEELDFVRNEVLATFGVGVVHLLGNLERSGMLVHSVRETGQSNLSWIPFPSFGGVGAGKGGVGATRSTGGSVRALSDAASTTRSTSSRGTTSDDGRRSRLRFAEYSWQFARAALRLVTDFDPEKPVMPGSSGALASPYSGYTPLSVRLVEAGLSEDGWGELPPIGAHTSLLPPGHATVEHRREEIDSERDEGIDAVIVFVGGIARAEATAVRLAARAKGLNAVIATTAVMGPDEFVMSLDDTMVTTPRWLGYRQG